MDEQTQKQNEDNAILLAAIRSIGDGVIVSNAKGEFLVFNQAAEKMIGMGKKDIPVDEWATAYGTYLPDQITPLESNELPLALALKGIPTNNREVFIKNPANPAGVTVSVNGRPIYNALGHLIGGVVVFRDVSERKRLENELKSHTQDLETRVNERTAELTQKIEELEKINQAMVGRELKMVELKKENDRLKNSQNPPA